MALADHRGQRSLILCALYFAQGVPWGFMAIALASYLASRGVSDAGVGAVAGMVLLPWTFKLVWAPLIDTLTVRSMGRRRAWIIGAELMMAFTMLGLLMMGDLARDLRLLGWMFFLHNCFASLQDVATDALAVDVLPPEEQGRMNGLMWGSKLVGKGAGAAGMGAVMAYWGLAAAVMVQFVLLMCIMLLPIFMLERRGEKRFPWSAGAPAAAGPGGSLRNPKHLLGDMCLGFSLLATFAFAVFAAIKHIGWGIVEVVSKTLCTQQLGWEFIELTNVSGAAIVTELAGAVLGGYLADRFGRRRIMAVGFGSYGLLAITFALCAPWWHSRWIVGGYLFLSPGLLAVGSVGFLSMAMRISWTGSAATMFTTYMTLSNVGHVAGNWLAGPVRGRFSYEHTMLLAGVCVLAPLVLLLAVRPGQVDHARQRRKWSNGFWRRKPQGWRLEAEGRIAGESGCGD